MWGSKHIKSMQRRTSFFSHHPRVSGSCCANSWDRFTAQKMRYPLPPSVRNTKKLARNLRNLIKWTFSSTWAALSSMIASCTQAKQKKKCIWATKTVIHSENIFFKHPMRNENVHSIWDSANQVDISSKWEWVKEGRILTNSDWSNTRTIFFLNSLLIKSFFFWSYKIIPKSHFKYWASLFL